MALKYASKGWRVHPLHHIRKDDICSCGSRKCNSPGKHPRLSKWPNKATTDHKKIRQWWKNNPDANIGIVLDDLIVIDVDTRNGGSLTEAIETYPELGEIFNSAYYVKTGNGCHYYFEGGFKVEKKHHLLGKGIDVLTGNHYVVAPPSNHISGNCYELIRDEVSEMPPVLAALINPMVDTGEQLKEICEGQRNNALARIAGKLRRQGLGKSQVKTRLLEENALRCKPPLDLDEVIKIVDSIMSIVEKDKKSTKTVWQEAVVRDHRITDKQCRILMDLSFYMDKDGRRCFPSQQTVADDVGCTRKTVANHIEIGMKEGYLIRYPAGKELVNHLSRNYGYIAKLPNED